MKLPSKYQRLSSNFPTITTTMYAPKLRIVQAKWSDCVDRRNRRAVVEANHHHNSQEVDASSSTAHESPGPLDPILLYLQEEHRSQSVWKGETKSMSFMLQMTLPVHPHIRNYLVNVNFN